jgi:hypothetical protein
MDNGGYEHVTEFIPVGQPSAQTMTKIKSLKPSTDIGDRLSDFLLDKTDILIYLFRQPSIQLSSELKHRLDISQESLPGLGRWFS